MIAKKTIRNYDNILYHSSQRTTFIALKKLVLKYQKKIKKCIVKIKRQVLKVRLQFIRDGAKRKFKIRQSYYHYPINIDVNVN